LAPVVVLVLGFALLGAGLAGVARVDSPLATAAAEQQRAPQQHRYDVDWHHGDRRDCPPDDVRPTRT
jgi:hypothetical protein